MTPVLSTTRLFQTALLLVTGAAFVPFFIVLGQYVVGDASIYFVFFKRFFSLPFSFQESVVSFGATSPLHVVLFAPIHHLAGESWFQVAKVVNMSLVALSAWLLNLALGGRLLTLSVILILFLLHRQFLLMTGALFETGIMASALAVTYLLLRRNDPRAVYMAGLLYLVRPELAVVTVAVCLYLLIDHRVSWRPWMARIAVAAIPVLLYHIYMGLMTGELIPSSILARSVLADLEHGQPWLTRGADMGSIVLLPDGAVYLWVVLAALTVLALGKVHAYRMEFLLFIPLALLFLISPPSHHVNRYLFPLFVCGVPIAARLVGEFVGAMEKSSLRMLRYAGLAAALALPATLLIYGEALHAEYKPYQTWARRDYDTILLKDLASVLNPLVKPTEKVLLYEIQGQYYLDVHSVSADAIVGSQMLAALTGQASWWETIDQHGIDWVVTMNSFNYRRVYRGTLLERLYAHDLVATPGESMQEGGLVFEKALTNPVFASSELHLDRPYPGLSTGTTLRVYGRGTPWAGHSPIWNSVYRVRKLEDGRSLR